MLFGAATYHYLSQSINQTVEENKNIAASNIEADKEQAEYERLMKEEEELKKALEELPGGGGR